MRNGGALWGHAPNLTGREQEESLALLDESQYLIGLIMLGVMLQFQSLNLERRRLLGNGGGMAPKSMQAAASLVTLGALFGFQGQANRLGEQCDAMLGANSIVIALIRLFRLLGRSSEESAEKQALALDEPVI